MLKTIFTDTPSGLLCLRGFAITAVLAITALPVSAATISIGSAGSVDTGVGVIDAGCSDVDIQGQLAGSLHGARHVNIGAGASAGGAMFGLSGDWVNQGPRELNTAIDWRDGCGVTEASMLGSSDLTTLHIATDLGRVIRFDSQGEQRVEQGLALNGNSGQRLRLRPSAEFQFAALSLDFGASQQIAGVDVAYIDSSAGQAIAPGTPDDYDSVRDGPVRNWFVLPAVPVPAMGVMSTFFLIALMGLLGLLVQPFDLFGVRGVTRK